MADNKTVAPAADAPKKRKSFTRNVQPKTLNILLTLDEAGAPQVEIASYNAQDTLTAFVTATAAGKSPKLVTWQEPKKPAKTETPAA